MDKPIVLTFHDVIHEKFMTHDTKTLANKKRALQRADKIIAVSESTKCDIGNYYSIPEKKIVVIPLASSIASAGTLIGGEPRERYLLFVGGRQLYKNFSFFVAAIASLLAKDHRLFLYCAGGGVFTKEERKLFHTMDIQSKVKYFAGTDENLKKCYSGALAFIFPSLYEGFGMPLLEAMSCGCPIGASQTSSFPEVAGSASLYFDPTDRDSILEVVEALVSDKTVRMRLSRCGLERAKSFSWRSTALQTEKVYRGLI
jgi:glycosyltransferase involved in cell wall biosynthesis